MFDYVRNVAPSVQVQPPGALKGPGQPCAKCGQCKMSVAFNANSLCMECEQFEKYGADALSWGGSKQCYYCKKMLPNSAFSVNQRKKAAQGLASCYACVEKGSCYTQGDDLLNYAVNAPKQCAACGDWKHPEDFSLAQLKNNWDAPKCQ